MHRRRGERQGLRWRLVAVSAAAALAAPAAGCSADETGPDPGGDVDRTSQLPDDDALRAGLADLYAGTGATEAGARTADCFAAALLERTDAGALADARLLVEGEVVAEAPPLPEPLARHWYAAQESCTDYVTVSARAQRAATKGRIDEPAYERCLRSALTDAQIEEAVVATLTAEWDAAPVQRLSKAQARCADAALPDD